jgi:hypothetical protein
VHSFISDYLVLTQTLRGYACTLIVRSWAVDPRHTASMIVKEETARQHFEELKGSLPKLLIHPRWWKKDFKYYVDKFIGECLYEKKLITALPPRDKEEEESNRICLYRLRRLVASAVQEWELVQQPKHATMCAKLDGTLVWQGRGYVSPILQATSLLNRLLQC